MTTRWPAGCSDDGGFTLIEVVMALAIFATAGIAFVVGVGAAVRYSDGHRAAASVQTIIRNQAESLYQGASACTSHGTIANSYSAPAGYAVSVAYTPSPRCPDPGSWVTASITAQSTDGRSGVQKLDIVLRSP